MSTNDYIEAVTSLRETLRSINPGKSSTREFPLSSSKPQDLKEVILYFLHLANDFEQGMPICSILLDLYNRPKDGELDTKLELNRLMTFFINYIQVYHPNHLDNIKVRVSS